MTALSVTAASVLASTSASKRKGTAGATITRGQVVYEDTADLDASGKPKLKLADANDASSIIRTPAGIALQDVASGQSLEFVEQDASFTPGGTLTVGTSYYLSGTAGGIIPSGDLATGIYPSLLFIATTAALANMKIVRGGAAIP